jgi:regulator of replication initiation timing
MNGKLEQKSQQILKKWDIFKRFEEKSKEDSDKANKLHDTVEELNRNIQQVTRDNEILKRKLDSNTSENLKLNVEVEELRKHVGGLKQVNEELQYKNNELEQKFKRTLEQRNTDSRDNSSITVQTKEKVKTYHSMALKNLNNNYNITNLVQEVSYFVKPRILGLI